VGKVILGLLFSAHRLASSSAKRHFKSAEGGGTEGCQKKDYELHIDSRLKKLKEDEVMRDLHTMDLRDSAEEAGDYFHMAADRITDQPNSPAAKCRVPAPCRPPQMSSAARRSCGSLGFKR
jgi:hypothetical protein